MIRRRGQFIFHFKWLQKSSQPNVEQIYRLYTPHGYE